MKSCGLCDNVENNFGPGSPQRALHVGKVRTHTQTQTEYIIILVFLDTNV
jgi:hypothetical protein